MKKKCLSIILTLAMLVTMIPAMSLVSNAEQSTSGSSVVLKVDANESSPATSRAEGATFNTVDEAISVAQSGDTIKLESNVNTDKYIQVYHKNLILDLNGKTLSRNSGVTTNNGYVILLGEGGKLTVTDSSENKTGVITGGNNNDVGGCVCLYKYSTFVLEAGTISGNKSVSGTVFVSYDAAFIMKGGAIKNNEVTQSGGAVYSCGTFEMYGGEISDNKAVKSGGGVYLDYDHNTGNQYPSTFIMEKNAAIKNNVAGDKGGGIYVDDFANVLICGTIMLNKATNLGGGICTNTKITVGDGVKVYWNKQGDTESNVTLRHDTTSSEGAAVETKKGGLEISKVYPLAYNALIGVSYVVSSVPNDKSSNKVTQAASNLISAKESDAKHFFADGAKFGIKYDASKQYISIVNNVASIGNVGYLTLQEAVNAAEYGETITILDSTNENVVVNESKQFKIVDSRDLFKGTIKDNSGNVITPDKDGNYVVEGKGFIAAIIAGILAIKGLSSLSIFGTIFGIFKSLFSGKLWNL